MVKNSLAIAEDTGWIPIPMKQLSPCATPAEAQTLEPVLRNKRSHHKKKPVHHS